MKKEYKPLGLYIHIPFCKSKCIYCDFYSLPRAEDRMDRYVSALCRQLAEIAQRTRWTPSISAAAPPPGWGRSACGRF